MCACACVRVCVDVSVHMFVARSYVCLCCIVVVPYGHMVLGDPVRIPAGKPIAVISGADALQSTCSY